MDETPEQVFMKGFHFGVETATTYFKKLFASLQAATTLQELQKTLEALNDDEAMVEGSSDSSEPHQHE